MPKTIISKQNNEIKPKKHMTNCKNILLTAEIIDSRKGLINNFFSFIESEPLKMLLTFLHSSQERLLEG